MHNTNKNLYVRKLFKKSAGKPCSFITYENIRTGELQKLYTQLLNCDRFSKAAYSRVSLLIEDETNRFLKAIGAEKGIPPTSDVYGQNGIEIVEIPFLCNNNSLSRYLILSKHNSKLDNNQIMLIYEYQLLLFKLLLTLQSTPDEIFELSARGIINHTIARYAMFHSLNRSICENFFWNGYISPATIFNERLLNSLLNLLTMSYEGNLSTVSVWLIDRDFAYRLRWTPHIQSGLELFTENKFGRIISNHDTNVGCFFSGDGEWLGLYNIAETLVILGKKNNQFPIGICEWRIQQFGTLSFYIKNELRLEYHDGHWRYVNLIYDKKLLINKDHSFQKANSIIWDVCVSLSEKRRSAIFLIVDNIQCLIEKNIVSDNELNLSNNLRLPTQVKKERYYLNKPIMNAYKTCPKEYILEQYRGKTINRIGKDILFNLACLDGAIIIDKNGYLLGYGIILQLGASEMQHKTEGAGARAVRLASEFGTAIKVSIDGPISAFVKGEQLF